MEVQEFKTKRGMVKYLDEFVATQDVWTEEILMFPKWLPARNDYSTDLYKNCWFDSE